MDNRRHQLLYVGASWALALLAVGSYFGADGMGGSATGRAPTERDCLWGCLSVLLHIAALGLGVTGAIVSLAGLFLVRSPWVIACAVAAFVSVSPWLLMLGCETVFKAAFR